MIVGVIVVILVSIASPSYQKSIRKGHRNDGQVALMDAAGRQEIFYAKNASYTSDLDNLNISDTSPEGYYTIAISSANSTSYIITATPTSKGSQNEDSVLVFRLNSSGQRQFKNSTGWHNGWNGY